MAETKRSESGKRYSRIVQRTFENLEEGIAEWKSIKPFQEKITDEVNRAREFLRSRGLPDAQRIVKSRKTGEWEPYNGQTADEVLGGYSLDHYILKVCNLERDSFEHLAARFIMAAAELERPERDRAILGAFQLGELNILTRVYGTESQHGRRITQKNKRREWAEALAERITSWDDIPDVDCHEEPLSIQSECGDFLFYRTFDERGRPIVQCVIENRKGQKIESLVRRSFVDRYLRPKMTPRTQKQR